MADQKNLTEEDIAKQTEQDIKDAFEMFKDSVDRDKDKMSDPVKDAFRQYKDVLTDCIGTLITSDEAIIHNNQAVADTVYKFISGPYGKAYGVETMADLNRYKSIVEAHISELNLRKEIGRKDSSQLTVEDKQILGRKTMLENLLAPAVNQAMAHTRSGLLRDIETRKKDYIKNVIVGNFDQNKLLKGFSYLVESSGKVDLRDPETGDFIRDEKGKRISTKAYEFYKKDIPSYVYDETSRKNYVKVLTDYSQKYAKTISRELFTKEAELNAYMLKSEYISGQGTAHMKTIDFNIMRAEKQHDYLYAKEDYEKLVKENQKDPNYNAHYRSAEYAKLLEYEYYDTKFQNKLISQIPKSEQPIHIFHTYAGKSIEDIPMEYRDLYDEGAKTVALVNLDELGDKFRDIEARIKKFDAPEHKLETKFQLRELEENKKIVNAYRNYLLDGSEKNLKKYHSAVQSAFNNMSSASRRNPDLAAHFVERLYQLRTGDFTFIPTEGAKRAQQMGMIPREQSAFSVRELANAAAYRDALSPIREKIMKESYAGELNRVSNLRMSREFNLDAARANLTGDELEEYKENVNNMHFESFVTRVEEFKIQLNDLAQNKNDLKKEYNFIKRIFSKEYKEKLADIDAKIDEVRRTYQDEKDKIRLDVLKTYKQKGIPMTLKEKVEMNELNEKIKLSEQNKAKEESQKEAPEAEKVAKKTALDLGDKIHQSKAKEVTVKEEPKIEKDIVKEEKVQEDLTK